MNAGCFGKACLAIERKRHAFRKKIVVLLITRKSTVFFEIGIHPVMYFAIISAQIVIERRAVQLVQTYEHTLQRENRALIPFFPVGIRGIEHELLIAVVVVIGNCLSSFRDAPPQSVPLFHRIADRSIRSLNYDLARIMKIDIRVLRYKAVKGFQSLAACQHLLYRPVSVRQSFHLAQFFFHLLCLSFCNGNSFPNTSK